MKKTLVILIVIIALCLVAPIVSTSFAAPNHGVISIAFDDGMQNQYDYAFPLMQARGIKATFYVITDKISDFSNNPSYMSIAELQTLQGNGNEIGSHSKTHPPFTQISDSQIREECSVSKQVLQSYGFAADNFAYPYGGTDDHIDSIVSQYYRSARSAYAPPYIMPLPTSQFRLTAFAGETGDSTALPQLKNMVDQVYSTNGWTIIFFHNTIPGVSGDSGAISTQEFASFLDYIISKGVQTLTVNQALDLGSPPVTPLSVTISPTSVRMYVGQSQTFSSSVSGGEPPYTYQWYLNNAAVSGANSISWTFTPTQAGFYNVYLNITDSLNSKAQSNIVNDIQVYNQYPLTMSTNYGTVSPSSGQYDVGSTISISATAPVAAVGESYVWLGWTGSGVGSYTGMNNPASITMNGAITETASWTRLKVEAPIDVTGHYAMQYTIEMFGVIAIPVILVVLVIGVILLRRRRKKT